MQRMVALLFSLALAGCANAPVEPMKMEDAIASIRLSLVEAQKQCKKQPELCQSGLFLSNAEITLQLTKIDTRTVGVSIPVGVATFTTGGTSSETRANTITLKFQSGMFAPQDSPAAKCAIGLLAPVPPAVAKSCKGLIELFY